MVEQTKVRVRTKTIKNPSNPMTGVVMREYAQGLRPLSCERKRKGWTIQRTK